MFEGQTLFKVQKQLKRLQPVIFVALWQHCGVFGATLGSEETLMMSVKPAGSVRPSAELV